MMVHLSVSCMYLLLVASSGQMPSMGMSNTMTFSGRASGGTLTLVRLVPGGAVHAVTIETEPGEEASSVVSRLAEAVNRSSGFLGGAGRISPWKSSLRLPEPVLAGPYLLAGTETGLGEIPAPPTSLSGSFDEKEGTVALNWINPSYRAYEVINVYCEGIDVGGLHPGRSSWVVRESAIQRACRSSGRSPAEGLSFRVVGQRGAPSNAGVIHVKGRIQEELMCIPFTSGIAPNWIGWRDGAYPGAVEFLQGTRPGRKEISFSETPAGNPLYQLIGGSGRRFGGGLWRKFLGLAPGHTYRVSVRVNTLSLDASSGDWDFSVHACPDGPSGSNLTVDQLAGRFALPDGRSGREAGQIAKFDPSATTGGKWVQVSTEGSAPGKVMEGNITLPPRVRSISVWLRHGGRNMNSKGVGMDWISLEDLTP